MSITSDLDRAKAVLCTEFGIEGDVTALVGEHDLNVAVHATNGQRYVLKVMHGGCPHERVDFQCQILAHLKDQNIGVRTPTVIPNTRGEMYASVDWANESRVAWLIEHLDGTAFARLNYVEPALLENLGKSLGRLDVALAVFDHPFAKRSDPWNLTEAARHLGGCTAMDAALRELAVDTLSTFTGRIATQLDALPCQVIHNDANDYNLLVEMSGLRPVLSGLIDFGDAAWQPAVCELAIACAYAAMDHADPLTACAQLVRGYASARPLSVAEVDVLPSLIRTRLAVSLAISTQKAVEQPNNAYLTISQAPARRLLEQLHGVPDTVARIRLRQAAGLSGLTRAARIERYLATSDAVPAIDAGGNRALVLDLGVGSRLLGADPAAGRREALQAIVDQALASAGKDVAVGRYLEPRLLYDHPSFGAQGHPCDERRTVHLGVDVFCAAGTNVVAPLRGTVYCTANMAQPLDYGPMVMLQHETPDGEHFYTLYGHLELASVQGLQTGDKIEAGEVFVRVGAPPDNGDWPPHLHLQIILDDLGLREQFPGVCTPALADVYSVLSPDPSILLGLEGTATPVNARRDDGDVHERRRELLSGALSLAYERPLHIVRGFGQYLYDDQARAYLDIYNNVAHVGHSHPHVVQAVQQQVGLLNTNTRYAHRNILDYAERLTAKLPSGLDVCFFVNSASEANELALRIARAATGRRDMVVAAGAYHGHTSALIDMSPYKYNGPGGAGRPDWVHEVPVADDYRGEFRRDDPDAGAKYAAQVEALLSGLDTSHLAAGFIAETLPSVGGQLVLPAGYLEGVYRAVRAHGGLCIADEVQTGFGRLGDAFWGFSDQNVVPDMVVLGKPIANGFPMGALVTTREIADQFDNGMEFFATFGGNPVACAAATAMLDVVENEDLAARAERFGRRFLDDLLALKERYPVIGDVRGKGFFLGLELVHDHTTLTPAADVASFVVNRLRDHHVLAGIDGPLHNVIKMRPTMVTTEDNLSRVITILDGIFAEVAIRLGG